MKEEMASIAWFKRDIEHRLSGYSLSYSSFLNGDFGDLERIELEGFGKLATIEFWSKGWLGIDVYDCCLDAQIMNVLLSPEERNSIAQEFEKLIKLLKK